MRPDNAARGRAGEDAAARYLAAAGYAIVRRNLRLPGGEVDLLCREGGDIVFVEVKNRGTRAFGTALSAVDHRKRGTLRRLAADYVQIVAPGARVRFDVVAVDGERITLHRNAF